MENKIIEKLNFISLKFPNSKFEIVNNCLSPTLKHFIIKDCFKNKGFGSDHNLLTSIEKSYSEFIERIVFSFFEKSTHEFPTSNGFSAHKSSKLAAKNSILEIIERDAFLNCWHNKWSPYWLLENDLLNLLSFQNLEIVKNHQKNGLKLKIGIVAQTNEFFTLIASVSGIGRNGKSFFYIDTKAGSSIEAVSNSLIESISFFSHFIIKGISTRKNLKLKDPIDHFFYYLNNKDQNKWFSRGQDNVLQIKLRGIQTFEINVEQVLGLDKTNRKVTYAEAKC